MADSQKGVTLNISCWMTKNQNVAQYYSAILFTRGTNCCVQVTIQFQYCGSR